MVQIQFFFFCLFRFSTKPNKFVCISDLTKLENCFYEFFISEVWSSQNISLFLPHTYTRVTLNFLRQWQIIWAKKKKNFFFAKKVYFNCFMAINHNFRKQLKFSCDRINFEQKRNAVDMTVLLCYNFFLLF